MEFGEDGKAGDEDPLKQLGKSAVEVDASKRGGAGAILLSPLEYGLDKALLPRLGLSVVV